MQILLSLALLCGGVHAQGALSPLELEIGQMIMPAADVSRIDRFKDAIERGEIGGILLQWGKFDSEITAEAASRLQSWAAKSPLGRPLLVAVDYEGGPVFSPETLGLPDLPTNMMMGASGSERDCAFLFYLAGQELKKAGINMNFAPVLDINTEPENPIIGVRAFGDNPADAARLGAAVIGGLNAAGVAPVAKHFPGHGAAFADSHKRLPVIYLSSAALAEHILPFERAASSSGAAGIMTAHALYPALDGANIATFSTAVVQGMLRGETGYRGLVVSDSLDMKAASPALADVPRAAARAAAAGVNLLLTGGGDYAGARSAIMRGVEDGAVPRSAVAESCRLVGEVKAKYAASPPEPAMATDVSSSYLDVSRKIAREAVTVVRSSSGMVPFVPAAARIPVCAVFFVPARFSDNMIPFSGAVMGRGWTIQQYNSRVSPGRVDEARALECAAWADITVIGSFQWAGSPVRKQVGLVRKLLRKARNPVLVSLMNPYDINMYPEAKNVIAIYGTTKFSAAALGEILTGQIPPQGRLPVKLKPWQSSGKPHAE
ncbi:MAG: glycoside hydrolase family 3 N-terminal domain-containing protein [Elusimicrobiales bacterium]